MKWQVSRHEKFDTDEIALCISRNSSQLYRKKGRRFKSICIQTSTNYLYTVSYPVLSIRQLRIDRLGSITYIGGFVEV